MLQTKPRSTVRSPARPTNVGEGSLKPLSANASSTTVTGATEPQLADDEILVDEVVEMANVSGVDDATDLRGSQETQAADASDMEVEEGLLNFRHSCSITITDEPPATDPFSQDHVEDPLSNITKLSPDDGMDVDNVSRAPSLSVSDYMKTSIADGNTTTRSSSLGIADEDKVPATDAKEADDAAMLFDDHLNVEGVPDLTAVSPMRFYRKALNNAKGKQKAKPVDSGNEDPIVVEPPRPMFVLSNLIVGYHSLNFLQQDLYIYPGLTWRSTRARHQTAF